MPPKKDNPGGGGNGGGGNGGGDTTFAVLGLDSTDAFLTGTGPARQEITATVTDGTETWQKTGFIDAEGNWSFLLSDFLADDGSTLFDQSGEFTVVATYTERNPKNNKERTVSTEETPLTLPSDNVAPALTALTYTGEDTGVEDDLITSDGTATFQVTFNEAVEVGHTITLVVNDSADASVTLTEDHLEAGFVELTPTAPMVEGENTISANLSTGGDIGPITLTLDIVAPNISGPATLLLDENLTRTDAFAFTSDDPEATWSLAGFDAALFQISVDGLLSFRTAPDFEAPADFDNNNIYELTVRSTDLAGNFSTQDVTISVADVVEHTPPTSYTNIVVFGDSLSDNGNFSDLAGEFFVRDANGELIYTVPFQYDGGDGSVRTYDTRSFSDGTTYADTLAELLALEAAYQNYAFGGAEAIGSKLGSGYITEYSNLTNTTLNEGTATFSIIEDTEAALSAYGDFDINLTAQVDRFIADHSGSAPEGTLAVLNIGGNDLSNFDTSFWNILLGGVNEFASDLGVQIEAQARRLASDAGVAGVALYTLPVAQFFLGYEGLGFLEDAVADDLLNSVNDDILYRARLLNADNITTEVVRIDIVSEELLADMQTHGFLYMGPYLQGYSGDPIWVETSTGVIEPTFIVETAATVYRPEQILYFDEIHPSGALHDMLAVFSSESLSTDQKFASGGADALTMTAADDFVLARGGNDVVTLGAGDDVALGGTGDDTLRGEGGSDLLIGGAGNDTLEGGDGSDFLTGSAGNDQLLGGADADILLGGLCSDDVFGEAGDDIFIFFEEALWGGTGGSIDAYNGGEGADTLLVFLSETAQVSESGTGDSTVLSFGQGYELTAQNIETIEFHRGLPEDADSPLAALALSVPDELLARYEEAELWGIV